MPESLGASWTFVARRVPARRAGPRGVPAIAGGPGGAELDRTPAPRPWGHPRATRPPAPRCPASTNAGQ